MTFTSKIVVSHLKCRGTIVHTTAYKYADISYVHLGVEDACEVVVALVSERLSEVGVVDVCSLVDSSDVNGLRNEWALLVYWRYTVDKCVFWPVTGQLMV